MGAFVRPAAATHIRSALLLVAAALVASVPVPAARADVIPPGVREAEQRLRDNPKAFDRVDQFCAQRKVGAACTLPGDALAGGGAGVCRNALDETRTRIDLSCVRRATVTIDRGLPAGGFVLPAHVCADPEGAAVARERGYGCTPAAQPLPDRFCAGRSVGAACEAALSVDGKPVRNAGVCARVTESAPRFYFRGWQVARRDALQCVSATPVVRDHKPVSWWQKVRQ
ncbi:MAG: hypothetical protein ACK5F5_06170 [Gammaproteobacteria bacterium]|jgi:hypothetical protein